MSSIHQRIQEMNRYFYTRETYDLEKRLFFLKKLKKSILKHQLAIEHSLYADFKKNAYEAYTTEILGVIQELNTTIKHLKQWAKPKKCGGALPVIGGKTLVFSEPYGVCAIFSPFNYPFHLAMMPLIGALAAGNCVVIKPSEYTPHTNRVIKKIIREVFPPYYVTVIEGDAQVANLLLEQPIDYIFFTGGIEVGKKIMAKASEHLIPVTLELGGKSPTIVDADADLKLAAQRIVWGKFLNGGQTCIAPDYVLVHESVADQLLCQIGFALQRLYRHPEQMTHIINESHYVRLLQLINEDKIYFGGHFNTDSLYIEPTVLYPVSSSDLCMQEEIFGPILPVIPYRTLEEAVRFVQRRPKPLACYLFGNNTQHLKYLLKHLSFGGGCINDTILHFCSEGAPFGGVGYSGMGAYHGHYSFKTFSHEKTVFISKKNELPVRFASEKGLALIKKMIR